MNRLIRPFDKYARAALIDRQIVRRRWADCQLENERRRAQRRIQRHRLVLRCRRLRVLAQEFLFVAVIPLGWFVFQLIIGSAALLAFAAALIGLFK